jgi:hypothetical protein
MPDIFIEEPESDTDAPAVEAQVPLKAPEQPDAKSRPQEASQQAWRERHKVNVSLMRTPTGKPGIFTAFAVTPSEIQFEDQEANEQILLLLRRHFITNVPWIFFAVLMLLVPLLLIPLLQSDIVSSFLDLVSPAFLFVALALYYLIVIGFILNEYATWFFQVGLITNIRVVDVDFNTLLSRNIAYTDLTDIVDTEAHQRGLLQGIFNFGNVGIQTAGVKANFEFTSIPLPNKVVDALSDLMRNVRRHE